MAPKEKEEPKKESEKKEEGTTDEFAESIVKDLDDTSKSQSTQSLAQDKKAEVASKE